MFGLSSFLAEIKKNKDLKIFLFVFTLGAFFRLFRLDLQSPWEDELFSIRASSANSLNDLWNWMKDDPHPPLYQTLLYFWFQLLQPTIFVGRLLSAISGLLVPFAFYVLAPVELKGRIKVSVSVLLSLSTGLIYYSQELRSYSLLVLFCTIQLTFVLKLVYGKEKNLRLYISLLGISLLASYTHFFGFIWSASIFLGMFIEELIFERKFPKEFFFFGISFSLLFLPVLYLLFNSDKIGIASWIPETGTTAFIIFFDLIFHSGILKKFVPGIVASVALSVGFISIYFQRNSMEKKLVVLDSAHKKSVILFGIVLTIFSIVLCILSSIQPLITARNLLVTAPVLYFLIATAFSVFPIYKGRRLEFVLILISFVSLYYFTRYYYKPYKEQWRESSQYIISTVAEHPKDFTLLCSSHAYNMEYFLKTAKITEIVPRLYTKEEVNLFLQDSSKKNLVILETSWKYLNFEELESLFTRSNFDRKDQLFYGMRVVTIRKK
ncbi:glycosyltransferase family 39 protein [Leptospira noguchii]|uniref:Glycosyltransferase family 39 protein n=1 Tax=Leptospira noguchii TaxID=28182 RepID=A0A9Q8RI27_9LEPT|nr:glycosyltransferase family 39 protein [Leptospira noguchii]TQE75574.1 dolichyl-phosphate-mannose--protein mannosyltransferase [Leptospira noguchii]UOG31929.1 glycosyltransferase family 39 protein [Leptospira noguchii]UOG51278.1 glycosyltransferase family 39 protein [Leptospira noguchii]UOG58028.1 glycosyltransferase family 39 protein [Leptospira noguchii]